MSVCYSVNYTDKNKSNHYENEYMCDTLEEAASKILEWHEIFNNNGKLCIEGKILSSYDDFKDLPDTYNELIEHIMDNRGLDNNNKYHFKIIEHWDGC
jgi:hypothetical protein